MTIVRTATAACLCVLLAGPCLAREVTREEKQQAACYDDVMRLCGQFVPDITATKACMADKKRVVSAACAAFYPESDPPVSRGRRR